MKTSIIAIPVVSALLIAGLAAAQNPEAEEDRRAAEARRTEVRLQEAEARERMREAEREFAEAARQIAELSSRNLPQLVEMEQSVVELMGKPRLGVTVGGSDEGGPVEGVTILGVTPGSAAFDAGLRAGDIITAVNGESLGAEDAAESYERLVDFMHGVEEGDKLTVEYIRDGNVGKVEVEPRVVHGHAYAWLGQGPNFSAPGAPVAPDVDVVRRFGYSMPFLGSGWGDMELVELSEGLGRYFGTDSGLLVVSAPESDALELQDGDVIQSIDGREPTSVGHALRILGSYQPGEKLELKIMRDKRRQTLKVEMPDNRRSFTPMAPLEPLPAVRPHPAPPVTPDT